MPQNEKSENVVNDETQKSIRELCIYQLEVYKTFRDLGCCPGEAMYQTAIQIEAVLRSGDN